MIQVQVRVENLKELRANFRRAPAITLKYLARATKAAVFEVESNVTEGGIMQFKTPRAKRSGNLVARWGQGNARGFAPSGLQGYTGPSVAYAPYVYFGTRRGIRPNKYMDRIAKAAEKGVQKHFDDAVEKIVDNIART